MGLDGCYQAEWLMVVKWESFKLHAMRHLAYFRGGEWSTHDSTGLMECLFIIHSSACCSHQYTG